MVRQHYVQCAPYFLVLDSVCTCSFFWSFGFSVHHRCCHNLNPRFPGDSKKHPIFIPVNWYGLGGFGFHSSLFGGHGEKVCLFNLYIILEIFDWYFEYIDVLLMKAVTWKLSSWTNIHCINVSDDGRYRVDTNYCLGAQSSFDVCTIWVGGTQCIILIKVCFYMTYITRIHSVSFFYNTNIFGIP